MCNIHESVIYKSCVSCNQGTSSSSVLTLSVLRTKCLGWNSYLFFIYFLGIPVYNPLLQEINKKIKEDQAKYNKN